METQGSLGHRGVEAGKITPSATIDENLLTDEEDDEFFKIVADEFIRVIIRDTIYYMFHYRGERHWECLWCGTWYTRSHRPAACQRCHSTIFEGSESGPRPWGKSR